MDRGRHARRSTASSSPASSSSTRSTRSPVAIGQPRPRRLARGRAARPAADRRGLDGHHQVRPGPHRPHPVHRRGRVPRGQAVGPDPGAAGPLPDPRRARRADQGGLRPDPAPSRENALIRQYTALLATEGVTLAFDDEARSTRSRGSPPTSTSAPRTSAPAGCTPCMERLLDDLSFTRPSWAGTTRAHRRRATCARSWVPIFADEDLSRYIL